MNILPYTLWKQYQSSFLNKREFATFLAQVTVQSDYLKLIKEVVVVPKVVKKKRKISQDDSNFTESQVKEEAALEDKYFGRGIFYQKFNNFEIYEKCSKDLDIDLINNPDLALKENFLIPIAIWYWDYAKISRFLGNFEHINKFLENQVSNLSNYEQMYNLYSNLIR